MKTRTESMHWAYTKEGYYAVPFFPSGEWTKVAEYPIEDYWQPECEFLFTAKNGYQMIVRRSRNFKEFHYAFNYPPISGEDWIKGISNRRYFEAEYFQAHREELLELPF